MVAPSKKRLRYLSWLTLFGMSAIGIVLITYLQKKDVKTVLLGGRAYYLQVITGLFFGSLSALLAVLFINGKRFRNVRHFFEDLMKEINPSMAEIILYSFCASVGEEVLFRAGIQPLPLMGIWPAAVIFVLLHGYINPANMNLTLYGLFLIVICSGFGYLFKFFGLTSSIIAHFIYDVAIFSVLKYAYRRESEAAAKV
ncbi:MAG: abortive infection bacteriophage resistance protein Abi superfamily [Bacteroidota bacterium]|nr:abortive infection bacteriophage resistance protein Abi superfamily [Bacteroidota bacterium]